MCHPTCAGCYALSDSAEEKCLLGKRNKFYDKVSGTVVTKPQEPCDKPSSLYEMRSITARFTI